MCGISGLFDFGDGLPPETSGWLSAMNGSLRHRGPDDEGIFFQPEHNPNVALAHRRLSIIDLSPAGHQPMTDPFGNVIAFNGEIYNYKELRATHPDHQFKTNSDTEVLMYLLHAFGPSALPQLNGMFAFAWYHHEKRQLLLARDRAGKKPLYYTVKGNRLVFSSEIKALLQMPWVKAETDDQALYDFLTYNLTDAPHTLFKGIRKLEPATLLIVDQNGIREHRRWWEHRYEDLINTNEEKLANRVFETLDGAVRYRMVADVPVGVFLSGGVDSSAVTALMRKYTSGSIKTFSVGFTGQESYDERRYAAGIAKQFNTDHIEKMVSRDEIAGYLPRVVEAFDDPLADATAIPIWFISKLAHENGVTVVQTGDGADELFAGYRNWNRYRQLYPAYRMIGKIPLGHALAGMVSKMLNEDSVAGEMLYRAGKRQEFFWGGAKAFKEKSKHSFLKPEWLSKINHPDSYHVIEKYHRSFDQYRQSASRLDEVDRMCYLGFHFQVPHKYLHRMDRLGMAHSIEIRSPFLDPSIISLALSLPSYLKTKNNEPKYILKKALERILPHENLYRRKMGFCVPLKEWASDLMTDYVESNYKTFCRSTGIFSEDGLKRQIHEIQSGNKNYTNNLWTIYFLINWYKRWMY